MPSGKLYQSPPGSGSNDGALPTVYDQGWPGYSNLTDAQKSAFQAFPQDLLKYSVQRRWLAEISGITVNNIPCGTDDRSKALLVGLSLGGGTPAPFKDITGTWHRLNAAAVTALWSGVLSFIEQLFSAENQNSIGINATPPTITTRKQIDAVYAAIAPNSPSATSPSAT